MNQFLLAAHTQNRAPSGCRPGLQQNANLFLREP